MATEAKTLDLTKGEGGFKLNNPEIGPCVRFHGQRVDLRAVTPKQAQAMADDKQFRLVTKEEAGKTPAAPPKAPGSGN